MAGLVCLKCRVFLRAKKTGVIIEEGMPLGEPLGDGLYAKWGPYKLWHADLFECPSCNFELVTGFARKPIAEHYEPDYAAQVARFPPICRVKACAGARP